LRLEAGLTQEQVGFEADLELGQQQPSLATVLKLAKALEKSGQELIGLVEAEIRLGSGRKR
jgi:transcriptional regulator with XRE-family HTH domain